MKHTSILIYLLAFNFIQGSLLIPENNSTINYTHVLFEWDQIYQAESYNFQLSDDTSFNEVIANIDNETSLYIHKSDITWDFTYFWRVRAKYSDNSFGEWIDTSSFSTGSKVSNAYSIISNNSSYNDGVTIFSSFFNYFSAMIDKDGNEIWNTADSDIVYYNTDYNGQLFGCYVNNNLEHYLPGIEFSIDNEYIWKEPNEHFLHHELLQLKNGNYIGLIETIEQGPIPIGPWTPLYQSQGYVADGSTLEFPWVGDKIVIWDQNTKEVLWEWNTFDYFSMLDYDTLGSSWFEGFGNGRYDWTHANALYPTFDENDELEHIYLSSRHLSRITKINYTNNELIWNMGLDLPSGEVDCGQDIGFSWQHSLTIAENGNILTLDNGNISQTLLNTDYPTSRGLEIEINESSNSCTANTIWEYSLPENYFGFASGNVQKLDNGNYLIVTVGDGGTALEVNSSNEHIWEGKLNLQLPNGAVYRANRISGLYPLQYSLTLKELNGTSYSNMLFENENYYTDYNNFLLRLTDHGDLFNNYSNFTIIIDFENESENFISNCILNDNSCELNISNSSNSSYANFQIIPEENQNLIKTFTVIFDTNSCSEDIDCLGVCGGNAIEDCSGVCNGYAIVSGCDNICGSIAVEDCADICGGTNILDDCGVCNGDSSSCQSCDTGYTYYENIPNSTIILDQSQCFNNIDLEALNDIISLNSLNIESPIHLGTQNWNNGRITRLESGNYYQGGLVTLTEIPESIGNMSHMSVLYLNYNELTSLPSNITNLSNLIYLVLSFNQITLLPYDIGDLSNLFWIDIGYNELESLPESIGELQNLVYLWIFNNNLTEFPDSICDLNINWDNDDSGFLPYFGSGGNQLCNYLPDCIENSSNLNSSIDPLYYSFEITLEQECDELCILMDINSDSIIDVIDIVAVVNIILGSLNPTEIESCAADINSDGIINVIDIVSIVNYILN